MNSLFLNGGGFGWGWQMAGFNHVFFPSPSSPPARGGGIIRMLGSSHMTFIPSRQGRGYYKNAGVITHDLHPLPRGEKGLFTKPSMNTPATKYPKFRHSGESRNLRKDWMPDQACPVPDTGSGMTILDMFTCRRNNRALSLFKSILIENMVQDLRL